MAAYEVGELYWKITSDTKDFDSGLGKTEKKTKTLGDKFNGIAKIAKAAFAVAAVAAIGKVSIELIKAASEAEETQNKFNVVFRDIKDDADAAATNLSDNFGLSNNAALDLLSSTGDLLTGFGFTQAGALDLSEQVNTLAVDLASFTNFSGGAEGASEALTKALLGERESIKALGISISEADIAQLAQDKGITGELDRQTKAALTLELAVKQSGNAIGDFNRSQDSFANKSRTAKAAVEDLQVELGKNLLPIATTSVSIFGDLAAKLADFVAERNKLNEARIADKEGNTTLEQQLLLLNERKAVLQGYIDTQKTSGLVSKANADAATERNQAEIDAINSQVAAIAARAKYEAIEGAENQRIAAEEAKVAAEQAARDAQHLEDIKIRDAAYAETEAGRRDAILAEIELFETYKESDEKAQEVLAGLYEQLEDIEEKTEDTTEAAWVYGDEIDELTAANDALQQAADGATSTSKAGLDAAGGSAKGLFEDLLDLETVTNDFALSALSGFEAVGEAIYNGADAAAVLGAATLQAGAQILQVLGAELAARAVLAGLAGNVPGAIAAAAGSAAAYVASGLISAAASDISSKATTAPDTTTTTSTETPAASGGSSRGGGGDIIINNLIALGNEAEFRKAARQLYPYMEEEAVRRGGS